MTARYFSINGRTTALISSGEHYGGLINLEFNYSRYLQTLARSNFSLTIEFSGSYVEPDSDCDPTGQYPADNPLSPANGSYVAPWLRTAVPGGPKGGSKFDLKKFDPRFFSRLLGFVKEASSHGIMVQIALFCGYDTTHDFIWATSPLNPANNVNGLAKVNRGNVYTKSNHSNPDLVAMLAIQKAMASRIVTAVKPFDNVLIELVFMTNKTSITADWGLEIVQAVSAADPQRTMVVPAEWALLSLFQEQLRGRRIVQSCGGTSTAACTAAATTSRTDGSDSDGSHTRSTTSSATYYRLPSSSFGNCTLLDSLGPLPAALQAVGGKRLTAFRNTYWAWFLSGGAAVYNLDWSYTVGFEDGTATDPQASGAKTPSGPMYRRLVSVLGGFVAGLELATLEPNTAWVSVSGERTRSDADADADAVGVSVSGSGSGGDGEVHVFGLAPLARGKQGLQQQFAAFLVGFSPGATCTITLGGGKSGSNGQCVADFVDPSTGGVIGNHGVAGGSATLAIPTPQEAGSGVALRVACGNTD